MKPTKTPLIRNSSLLAFLIGSVVFFTGCKKDVSSEVPNPTNSESQTANTGEGSISAQATAAYEGFGANAVGGSNSSTVYHVTNLSSSGTGSFRGGLGSNKTIVFDVSGTINGTFDLTGYTYLTIDGSGQTVTIDGGNSGDIITFAGSNTHHCILKNINVTNSGNDGINVVDGAHDIMITNCTSWGNRDGNIDVAGGNNVTVQYCVMGGGATGWSGDMLITSTNVSVHHNLFSPATSGDVGERCPFVHCNYSPVGNPNADIRNNVIWKFGRSGGTGSGYGSAVAYNATGNIINNYYYTAGTSPNSATNTDDGYGSGATGKAYIAGNVSGNSGVNPNAESNHAIYPAASVTTQDACTAASIVLAQAGARPLNSVAQSLINNVTLPNCTVTSTNQTPTANAGADQTITLPVSSVTLSGSGSDPDGSIASYAWSKVSGSGGTISSPSAASTTITGLTAGTYTFKLTVTDNKGATASDNVIVTVNNSITTTNLPPTVNAGADQTITAPASSVSLAGTASDPDGSITSYAWSKVSGLGGTISSPSSASTSITGLTAGSYTFKLTVTDNQGATASDNVNITVNSGTTTTTTGTLTFSELYDISSSVNTNAGPRNSVSTSIYRNGPGSFRTEIRAGDTYQRGEMVYTGTSQNNIEGAVEYDVYFQNWSGLDGGGHTIEWLPKTSGASAQVSLQNYGGKFDVVRAIGSTVTHQSGTLMSVTPNTWYKMRWEYRWSSGTDGYVRLYINGALYYSYTGKTADGSGQTFRIGQLRWANSGSTLYTTSVVYYDNLKVYSK